MDCTRMCENIPSFVGYGIFTYTPMIVSATPHVQYSEMLFQPFSKFFEGLLVLRKTLERATLGSPLRVKDDGAGFGKLIEYMCAVFAVTK